MFSISMVNSLNQPLTSRALLQARPRQSLVNKYILHSRTARYTVKKLISLEIRKSRRAGSNPALADIKNKFNNYHHQAQQ